MNKLTDQHNPPDAPDERVEFFQNLQAMKPHAIRALASRVASYLSSISARDLLSKEDKEEVINDALLITLKKIGEGFFVPTQADPATFAIAVAKNLIGNRLQKNRHSSLPTEKIQHLPTIDFDPEKILQNKEREKLLDQVLDQLGEPCRQIILLRYFEGIADEEAVSRQFVPFSSADSLKTKRSKCLKTLSELMKLHKDVLSSLL